MRTMLVVLAFAIAALASPTDPGLGVTSTVTATAAGPNPTEVYINSIAYGGTGCPQGSVGSFISTDLSTFTLIFDSFVASIGPGVAITSERVNCQLNIDLQYPSGFQYSILDTEFRGYVGIDKGVTAVQAATYYFTGSSSQASVSTTFAGPQDGDYAITDSVPFTSTIWSPCGSALPLNIDSQVRLSSTVSTGTGEITDDSIDGKITFVVGVTWETYGWEDGDDPLVEHLKHCPDCGWAIVATIETNDGKLSQEYPLSTEMIEARKATFADKWPHESKKGWKCKVKQLVESGWKYTPTPESDDMATCTYCALALDGWENGDKPFLVNNYKQVAPKKTKAKKSRTSKALRLSTQSALTIASDAPTLEDLPAEEGDSILTTATNATATLGGKKTGKAKKTTAKGRKTKAKKEEAVDGLSAPEPEDAYFEVKVDPAPKATRSRKRKSDQMNESMVSAVEVEAPAPKRRATRTRGSIAIDDNIPIVNNSTMEDIEDVSKPKTTGRSRGRSSTTTRKALAVSVPSLRGPIPTDEDIDRALEADLDRPLTDDEGSTSIAATKKPIRAAKVTKADHAMFDPEPIEIDDAAIEAELEAMKIDSKPLPKAKGAKGKQPRKPSAKQQAAAKKAAEAEAEALREAEAQRTVEDEASQQIFAELEQSISIQHSSPIVQPKRGRASTRQASRQLPAKGTRASVDVSMTDASHDASADLKEDSGDETDASMGSQSTVIRGGNSRRSKLTKGKGKIVCRNSEETVHQGPHEDHIQPSREGKDTQVEERSMTEEPFFTPASNAQVPEREVEEPLPKATKPKVTKGRGRPPNVAPPTTVVDSPIAVKAQPAMAKSPVPPRSQTPPAKQTTPPQSPQSSDAENQPPSSKPPASAKTPVLGTTSRIPLAASTPVMSPSKRNIIAGLQSTHPWNAVDLDAAFLKSPIDENTVGRGILNDAMNKARNGALTSPEKKMTVEEWIHHNAELAEEKLRSECEMMVTAFEREGGRAMHALEGVECLE
ncbi:hypothetical protein B7494_g1726 [Chlorociboria aeruginascens]|nr:hypothetical protein B7494_g1726 [Chlorociboria aeruginascens]